MSQYAVEGKDYAEVNMIESTNFYMNWENFAPTYRSEYCEFSGIDPATGVNYTEEDMVEHVWGGRENAEATKYRVGPLCSKQGMGSRCATTYELCHNLFSSFIRFFYCSKFCATDVILSFIS